MFNTRTICNDDFQRNTTLQCRDNVVTIRNNVAAMLPRYIALKVVVANRLVYHHEMLCYAIVSDKPGGLSVIGDFMTRRTTIIFGISG